VTNKTSNTLSKSGVVLARRRSAICPEVIASAFVKEGLYMHLQFLVCDKVEFSFK
jgi:hypothetical protein